jgi:hypothetical protein
VAGLVSIFAASAMSIIIMGVALEVSKLVATVWLKWNWNRAPRLIKIYLISAIAILMMITSMGIFGYLSRAHLDQNIISGDVQSKIALVDEKIKVERENIANAQQVIKQMDAAVNGVIATGDQEVKLRDGSTQVRSAAERSLQIRRSQAKDREALTKQIEASQTRIIKLQEEIAPVRAEMRKVEAEVGPIKYIAKLIYGDQTDQNMLEKAVTWVIIIIVIVFDPLAVVLLLASQYSFQWFRKEKLESEEETEVEDFFTRGKLVARGLDVDEEARLAEEANAKIAEIEKEVDIDATLTSVNDSSVDETTTINEERPIEQWNKLIEEAEKAVEVEKELEDAEILNNAQSSEKAAMTAWKADNPTDNLKRHKKLLERGVIKHLPWDDYLKPQADFSEDEAAAEALKWAQEQIDIKKKDNDLDGESGITTDKEVQGRLAGYQQNAEQSDRTIWQRIQDAKK